MEMFGDSDTSVTGTGAPVAGKPPATDAPAVGAEAGAGDEPIIAGTCCAPCVLAGVGTSEAGGENGIPGGNVGGSGPWTIVTAPVGAASPEDPVPIGSGPELTVDPVAIFSTPVENAWD